MNYGFSDDNLGAGYSIRREPARSGLGSAAVDAAATAAGLPAPSLIKSIGSKITSIFGKKKKGPSAAEKATDAGIASVKANPIYQMFLSAGKLNPAIMNDAGSGNMGEAAWRVAKTLDDMIKATKADPTFQQILATGKISDFTENIWTDLPTSERGWNWLADTWDKISAMPSQLAEIETQTLLAVAKKEAADKATAEKAAAEKIAAEKSAAEKAAAEKAAVNLVIASQKADIPVPLTASGQQAVSPAPQASPMMAGFLTPENMKTVAMIAVPLLLVGFMFSGKSQAPRTNPYRRRR